VKVEGEDTNTWRVAVSRYDSIIAMQKVRGPPAYMLADTQSLGHHPKFSS
jgi:hypothetical protein